MRKLKDYSFKNAGFKVVDDNGVTKYTAGEFVGDDKGLIYKNYDAFYNPEKYPDTEVVYIPETGFPEDNKRYVPADLVNGYTRQNLIDLTGSTMAAESMFETLCWQAPETLWIEQCGDSDENGHYIEAQMAYEKAYVPDFVSDPDRKGQAPVCYDEFFNNEWQDEECRRHYLDRLVELGTIDENTASEAMSDLDGTENIEEVVYSTLVAENVKKEYERFCADKLRQSKEEIFADSNEIQFYKEIHGYLTNSLNPLDYEHYKALSAEGESVIALLYDENLKCERTNIGDWDRITNFIDDYARRFHKEIFKEETELE